MTKQKKNGNGQDTVKENRKKYIIAAVAVLIAVSVIFLAVVLTGRPSSGEQAPSKELLAEQIAADAAIPGSVETTFLKLDEQGNAVFSGRIVQDGKTLFSCNEMILTADTLKIKDAEIADPAENVLFYLYGFCADGKKLFSGIRPEKIEFTNGKLLSGNILFSAVITPDPARGWELLHCKAQAGKTDLEIIFDLPGKQYSLSGVCETDPVINFGGVFGLYSTEKVQAVRMKDLVFSSGRPLHGKLDASLSGGMAVSGSFQKGVFTGKATVKQQIFDLTVTAEGKATAVRAGTDSCGVKERIVYQADWRSDMLAFLNCVIQEEGSPVLPEPLLFPIAVSGKQWTRISDAGEKSPVVRTYSVKELSIISIRPSAFRMESREYLLTHKTGKRTFNGVSITGKNDAFRLDKFDLETVNGAGRIVNAEFCMPAGKKSGTFSGAVKEDLFFPPITSETKGNLQLNNGVILKDVVIRLDKGQLQVSSPFRQVRGELKKELPFPLPEAFADVQMDGLLNWEYRSDRGLILTVKDARLSSGKLNFDAAGVNFSLAFPTYAGNLHTLPGQKITFASLSAGGYTFGKGAISFRMGEKFYLEQAFAEWCDGRITLFSGEFEADRTVFSADCTDVDFAKFLSQFGMGKFSGSGSVSGKIRFLVGKAGSVRLQDGLLQSAPDKNGVLKSIFADHTVMSSGSAETQRFAMEVLRDMTYAWVTCGIRRAADSGKTMLLLRFNGKANRELPYQIDPVSGELKRTEETTLLPALRMDVDFNINR